jgi:hypothetical protein
MERHRTTGKAATAEVPVQVQIAHGLVAPPQMACSRAPVPADALKLTLKWQLSGTFARSGI